MLRPNLMNYYENDSNSGVSYNARVLKWDTVIEQKVTELAKWLEDRSRIRCIRRGQGPPCKSIYSACVRWQSAASTDEHVNTWFHSSSL